MRILFLRNIINYSDSIQERELIKSFGLYPPIALCQLAAIGRKQGHDVHLIDAYAEKIRFQDLIRMIIEYSPDLIALSLWTNTFKAELESANEIKKNIPNAKIIVGGPHLDLYAVETMEAYPLIDYCVIGEGEETFEELLQALPNKDGLHKINGLFFRKSGEIIRNSSRSYIKNLDGIPFPAIDLLDLSKYYSIMAKNKYPIYMLSSRGCPFKCFYCVDQQFGRSVRFYSTSYVINYMKWLVNDLHVNEIHFYDDTFTINKERTLEICRMIQEQGLSGIPWTIRTRVDTIDEDILHALWESGCYRIGYGVESGNQGIMNMMNRKTTIEGIRRTFTLTRKYPFEIVANFMIGYLGESKATYKDTVNFALQLDPDFVHFSITQVEPNSELYRQALELNLIKSDEWKNYILGKHDRLNPETRMLAGKDYSKKDLGKMQAWAYLRFYFRPIYIWRQLKKLKRKELLFRNINMAIAMFNDYIRSICLSYSCRHR